MQKLNKLLKVIIEFIIITLILSLIEYLGGTILNYLFDIDMWDYTNSTATTARQNGQHW